MGFLTHYLEKHRLDNIPDSSKKNLEKLESNLDRKIQDAKNSSDKFEDIIAEYAPDISSLIERFSYHIDNTNLKSMSGILSSFKFVISIGTEVYQIVEAISDDIVSDGMTEEEAQDAKIDFGKHLVYFIWKTIDPLKGRLYWIPFKATIEKKLVFWIAGMGIGAAIGLFDAKETENKVKSFASSPEGKAIIIKALS